MADLDAGFTAELVQRDVADRVALLTLNRPAARNALNTALARELAEALADAEADDGVDVVVLTGADPAFCAGLDLKELGQLGLDPSREREGGAGGDGPSALNWYRRLTTMTKPVIGAVNGPAVTGGLELALGCDFLVASERASFADTHARVGALPGGGLTARLPQAVGLRQAKEMSFTGNYVDADTALRTGLVNHVVPHAELVSFTLAIAASIVGVDQRTMRAIRANYEKGWRTTGQGCLDLEHEAFLAWSVAPEQVEQRRAGIIDRGRSQQSAG